MRAEAIASPDAMRVADMRDGSDDAANRISLVPEKSMQGQVSIPDAIRLGLAHHQAGRLSDAEAIYQQILRIAPNHPDALHLLGVIAHQAGKSVSAMELINKAIGANPFNPNYYNQLGIVLLVQGRLEEAVACYHQALSLSPDYAEAHNNLGGALRDQGKLEEAVASYQKALSFKPHSPDLQFNLGNALKDQGNLEAAVACYRKALSIKPDYAQAHNNLGSALKDQGKLDEAVASYQHALSFKPDYGEVYYNLANAFKDQGKLEQAVAGYHQALSFKPDDPETHFNLGIALQNQGKLDEAVATYHHALWFKPDYAEAHNNLAGALNELGQADAALASCQRALALKELPEFKTNFVQCIRNLDFVAVDAGVRRLLARAVSEPWARPADLANASMRLIRCDQNLKEYIEHALHAWPTRLTRQELLGPSGLTALSDDPLLRSLLENAQVCELGLERFLTMVRHAMLEAATETADCDDLEDKTLAFYCAVARQCFINDFVFSYTDGEFDRASSLREKLVAAMESGKPFPALWLAAAAAYFPLLSLPSTEILLDRTWPESVSALLLQHIAEPGAERQYRDAMPRLTTVEDAVSLEVQQQYEENPYPKWIKLPPPGRAVSVDSYFRQRFPLSPFRPLSKSDDVDILVAGCGTGQESIDIAQQFPGAQVLAVDLSLSSLCYAKRKTQELGLANIEYAQGDIMKLGSIGRAFDVITSVGVLHHLAHPMAGWQELLSLLRPGGLMLLGLYSECARQNIVAARKFIAERGYRPNAEDIRRSRQDLVSSGGGSQFKQLTTFRDFYGTNECRDLLFHVQEHRFTVSQIKEMVRELGLAFVGFCLEPGVAKRYGRRFPDDLSMTNLDGWHAFETEFPDTFVGMYLFWVQQAGTPTP